MTPQAARPRSHRMLPSSRRLGEALLLAAACAVLSLSTPRTSGAAPGVSSKQIIQLAAGVTVRHEIAGGASPHLYAVKLEAGQYARVALRRRGVDLLLTVAAPGANATRYENPAGPESPLNASIIAAAATTYTVEVRPVEKWAAAGAYELQLEAVRTPGPEDVKRVAAERKVAEGRRLQFLDENSRGAALTLYGEARERWAELGDTFEQANAYHFIAQTHAASGSTSFEPAVRGYEEALKLRGDDDPQARAYTLLELARLYTEARAYEKSKSGYGQALDIFKALNNRRGQAAVLYALGLDKARQQQMEEAVKYYRQALDIYAAGPRDRHEEARAQHALGGALDVLGQPDRAQEFYELALQGWQETGDAAQEGNTYSSLAKRDVDRGMWQAAFDKYDTALKLYERGEAESERDARSISNRRASTLYGVGYTYAALGDYPEALKKLEQSLALRDRQRRGSTLMLMGYFNALAGDSQKALELCQQALAIQEPARDPRVGETYTAMGVAHARQGRHREALELYDRALAIQRNEKTKSPQAEAITQGWRGESHAALGAHDDALASYARARELWLGYGELEGAALALAGMARVERDLNRLPAALDHVKEAIAVIEPLRANVTSQQLRVSYFETKVDYYELFIHLSMRLREERGGEAMTAAAFEASERSRVRSLLDTLAEARVEAGLKSDAGLVALVEKYRRTRRELQDKKVRRALLPKEKAGEGAALELEITRLDAERERAEAEIRSRSPRYAALMYPQPLTVEEVRRLLDDDTCLWEVSLGEKASYAWALTTSELRGYALPPRAELEKAVGELMSFVSRPPRSRGTEAERARAETAYRSQSAALSSTLFGPVSETIKKKRLLIVADGRLRHLPFAALPSPGAAAGGPLFRGREIVGLPSASLLPVLRQSMRRAPPTKSVAVFADPVYETDDPRLKTAKRAPGRPAAPEGGALAIAFRDAVEDEGAAATLRRLPASLREANDIALLAPPGSAWKATGFDANRENVTSAGLSQYRVVHFATHGIFKEEKPELSGVVLSLYDANGRFREDGFLRLKDIYGLSLPVDMVVLSACRTGLGKESRGEGLIGLTRGFMYAGAPRVVTTLWRVNDDATAEFMKRFYEKFLKDGMAPAAALAAAQASMSEEKPWSDPYYWAGFILQGESN